MPYITHNIAATRQAFNLAEVRTRNVSGDAELTREDIERNADTIKNVRLWDHQPLLDTFGQIQELRTYYDFVSVDNDRYTINGELRQVMLSARELNSESLPNRTWINEHLTFTHGYGITLGPVNEVTSEGLPILFVKDIPTQSSVPARHRRERAEHLFRRADEQLRGRQHAGEGISLLEGRSRTSPPPTTAPTASASAASAAGCSSAWDSSRCRFCSATTSPPTAAILYHRNITDRVTTIAPFLRYDEDPYLVVTRGRPSRLDPRRLHDDDALSVRGAFGPRASTTSATR